MNRVLTREVAQAAKGSNYTRFYGVWSGDVDKELPRNKSVLSVLLLGERSHARDRELSQHAGLFRGYSLGSTIVVRGALHNTSPFSCFERVIRLRRG